MGTRVSSKDMDPLRPTFADGGVSLTKPTDGGVSLTKPNDGGGVPTEPSGAGHGAGVARKKDGAVQSLPSSPGLVQIIDSRVGLRVLTAAIAVVLVSALVWVFAIRHDVGASTDRPRSASVPLASSSPSGSHAPVVEPPPADTRVPSPTVNPSPSAATGTDPASTRNVTASEAASQLLAASKQGASRLQPLVGSWVPQVSSKCVGIPVDVEPKWIPNGVTDIQSVTIQQILGFNLSLQQRFGAITVLPTQVGISSDVPGSGACKGQTVWMSIVPKLFTHAKGATRWCSINVPPAGECQARLVSARGV